MHEPHQMHPVRRSASGPARLTTSIEPSRPLGAILHVDVTNLGNIPDGGG